MKFMKCREGVMFYIFLISIYKCFLGNAILHFINGAGLPPCSFQISEKIYTKYEQYIAYIYFGTLTFIVITILKIIMEKINGS